MPLPVEPRVFPRFFFIFFITFLIYPFLCDLEGKDIRVWVHFSPHILPYLTRLITSARSTLDGAFYRIDHPEIINSLIVAKKRGVSVRVVIDRGSLSDPAITKLIDAGIKVVSNERGPGLMHNKFLIVDERYVWTGSYNPTSKDLEIDDNAIRIDSTILAERYKDEFNELFKGIFGMGEKTKTGRIYVGDIEIETYFAPEDNVKEKILREIRRAEKSIHFAYFTFSDEDYSNELIKVFQNGVIVEGIVDDTSSRGEEAIKKIYNAGIRVIHSHPLGPSMHHKFMIIDMEKVITGSFNLTTAADKRNDENILIIHDRGLASAYYGEFKRLYRGDSEAKEIETIHYVYTKPNPATTKTTITYSLGMYPDNVRIMVFDVAGDLVKTVDNAPSSPGHNEYIFELRNDDGLDLANGVYIIQIEARANGRIVSGFTRLAILRR